MGAEPEILEGLEGSVCDFPVHEVNILAHYAITHKSIICRCR